MALPMLYQIFLNDHLISEPGISINKYRLAEVHRIIGHISPTFPATKISLKSKGFLVTFDTEKAINLFFKQEAINTLKTNNLTAELGK